MACTARPIPPNSFNESLHTRQPPTRRTCRPNWSSRSYVLHKSHALRVRHPVTFLQISDDIRLAAYMTSCSTHRASCRYSLRLPYYTETHFYRIRQPQTQSGRGGGGTRVGGRTGPSLCGGRIFFKQRGRWRLAPFTFQLGQ